MGAGTSKIGPLNFWGLRGLRSLKQLLGAIDGSESLIAGTVASIVLSALSRSELSEPDFYSADDNIIN